MRLTSLVPAAIALFLPSAVFAQGWTTYSNVEDRFTISFPAEVTVENISYMTEDGMSLPARRHVSESNGERYAVTSIDFAPAYEAYDSTVQGSMAHAATNYRQLGEVTYDAYARTDRIPGHQLWITQPDGHRLFVVITLHRDVSMDARRLIIAEANVPPGARPPVPFFGSLRTLDSEGNSIRYAPDGITRER